MFVDPADLTGLGVLCMGVILHPDTAKQRFAANSHFRNFSLGTAVKLEKKKIKFYKLPSIFQ